MKTMNINEIENLEGINLIDVREPDEYANGHIEGAKNIPMTGLIMNPEMFLNKEKTYYIMCQAGSRSLSVCTNLEPLGYDVINLEGGYMGYEK